MSHDLIPDDLWIRRLQQRADEVTPVVSTDESVTLRRGRRRRAVRRAAIVGASAAATVAIALGAAPVLRLVADDTRPAEPAVSATAGFVPSQAQLEERDRDLAQMAAHNGMVDVPEVAIVRWVPSSEVSIAEADCLTAAGYTITNVTALGFETSYPGDQEAAYMRADFVCVAQYPRITP